MRTRIQILACARADTIWNAHEQTNFAVRKRIQFLACAREDKY
jgi:hypothetical protein